MLKPLFPLSDILLLLSATKMRHIVTVMRMRRSRTDSIRPFSGHTHIFSLRVTGEEQGGICPRKDSSNGCRDLMVPHLLQVLGAVDVIGTIVG